MYNCSLTLPKFGDADLLGLKAASITSALLSTAGEALENAVLASSTVGIDDLPPEVVTTPPPNSAPQISPGNGDTDVPPTTDVRIEFTEPVQPYSVGVVGG